MTIRKSLKKQKKSIYSYKRYWYHLSSTLTRKKYYIVPWKNDDNRSGDEPEGKRICVAPSIAHCLTAIPYGLTDSYHIYRTESRVKASKPDGVFDSHITKEGWLQTPTIFVKMGTIDLEEIEKGENVDNVTPEAASSNEPRYSGRVLKWWSKINFQYYIK